MLELIVVDGRARGIIARDLVTGEIETYFADVVVLASGGYGNVFFLSTNAMGCNVTATWRAHRKGAYMANPCYTQIHPTCIPVAGDAPVEADADVGVAAQRRPDLGAEERATDCDKDPREIPEEDRDYYLERIYPAFGNLVPRDIASRQAKNMCDEGRGVGPEVDGVRRGRLPRLRRRHRAARPDADRGRSTATSSTCTPGSRARTPTRSRCGSTRPCTT